MYSKQECTQIRHKMDMNTAVKLLVQYNEVAQQKGVFQLNEASLLNRATTVALGTGTDPEVNDVVAKSLLIQGVHKGQKGGAYTLSDAGLLDKVVNFLVKSANEGATATATATETASEPKEYVNELDELSAPVPLQPKEI